MGSKGWIGGGTRGCGSGEEERLDLDRGGRDDRGDAHLRARGHGDGETDTVRTSDVLERIGSVVSAIPEGGFGVVSLSVGGHITRLNARSSVAVPAGTQVSVTQVISPTAVQVEPLFLP